MRQDLWAKALGAWEQGSCEEAAAVLETLLASFPDDVEARHLFGVVLVELGDYDRAVGQLASACEVAPENGDALSAWGNALRLAGRPSEAETALRRGLALLPARSALHFNLGLVLLQGGRLDEAETAFLTAAELDPSDADSWLQLGRVRYRRAAYPTAAAAFLQAARLDEAGRPQATRLAGLAYADGGQPELAESLLASLCPDPPWMSDDAYLLSQLLYCRLELCDWRGLDEIAQRCRQLIGEGRNVAEPFTFLLLPCITGEEQLMLTANFVRGVVGPDSAAFPLPPPGSSSRCLRLGYLSADFHDHAVMRLLVGVLERHDHARFEVHGFSYGGPDEGGMRQRVIAACDFFHDISDAPPERMAQRIHEQGIDILVDLTGWTGNSRSALLGFRPAPIQVNWLGYSGTLGSRRLADYLIGDPVATPLEHQHKYAEQLVLLPHCCHPADDRRRIGIPPTREAAGLPCEAMVFCCFSRPLKIIPEIFHCWCDVLGQLPNSVLWLLDANPTARANLVAIATARGIDPGRLVFSAAKPPEEHLARLSLADLALDTFPFGAHTTAGDALWAGVPVVTLKGDAYQSRMTASMLHATGLEDLVACSVDDYRAKILALAKDPPALAAVRHRLGINRLSCPLFDTRKFVGDLEALLRSLWQRHCRTAED